MPNNNVIWITVLFKLLWIILIQKSSIEGLKVLAPSYPLKKCLSQQCSSNMLPYLLDVDVDDVDVCIYIIFSYFLTTHLPQKM